MSSSSCHRWLERERERTKGAHCQKVLKRFPALLLGGVVLFFLLIYSTEMSRYRLNRIDCVKKQKEDSFFTLVLIMHLLTRPVASIRNVAVPFVCRCRNTRICFFGRCVCATRCRWRRRRRWMASRGVSTRAGPPPSTSLPHQMR